MSGITDLIERLDNTANAFQRMAIALEDLHGSLIAIIGPLGNQTVRVEVVNAVVTREDRP